VIAAIHALTPVGRIRIDTESTEAPALVPSANIMVEIEGTDLPGFAFLNNLRVKLNLAEGGVRAYLLFDFHRSVGFHRLEVADTTCLFGTEDAKLQLAGMEEMLDYVGDAGLSWGHQLFFADGTSIRHPKVDYAWLTTHAEELIAIGASIADEPRKRGTFIERRSRPTGGKVLLQETFRLLRRNPRLYLDEHSEGIIAVGTTRYHPRAVVMSKPVDSSVTIANRRVAAVLRQSAEIAAGLLAHVPKGSRPAVLKTQLDCEQLLDSPTFQQLGNVHRDLPAEPTIEELTDERYARMFELHEELRTKLGWEAARTPSSPFAYVEYADQIYQAFVALTMAHALGASLAVPALKPGLSVPCFRSERFAIYYDTIPPKPEFANWRDASRRPADMRPDLTIIDVEQNTGILIDAKYRVEKTGTLSTSALNEAQVYMQSFGVKKIGICYPGSPLAVTDVAAQGNVILEIPNKPDPGLEAYLLGVAVPAIIANMEPL
jgi:hypothetical protein